MKEINAYLCADGLIFADEDKAKSHDDDLLGQELDGLLKLFEFDGNHVTRNDEYKALMRIMKKRNELASQLRLILKILDHGSE